jgi:hypothetical protein
VENFIIISAQETVKPDYIKSGIKAQSQTKGMTMLLKLKEPVSVAVYKINLKYQLQTDSLRATSTESIYKKQMHRMITQNKNRELKNVLTLEQYNTYIQCLENARNKLNSRLKEH